MGNDASIAISKRKTSVPTLTLELARTVHVGVLGYSCPVLVMPERSRQGPMW